jgi:hypothetical protein
VALTRWGFIYTLGPDGTEVVRGEAGSPGCVLITAGVPSVADAPAVAAGLVDEGAQLIELCGAFGPSGTAAVVAAVGDRVPVGGVYYGGEATDALAVLFSPGPS